MSNHTHPIPDSAMGISPRVRFQDATTPQLPAAFSRNCFGAIPVLRRFAGGPVISSRRGRLSHRPPPRRLLYWWRHHGPAGTRHPKGTRLPSTPRRNAATPLAITAMYRTTSIGCGETRPQVIRAPVLSGPDHENRMAGELSRFPVFDVVHRRADAAQ